MRFLLAAVLLLAGAGVPAHADPISLTIGAQMIMGTAALFTTEAAVLAFTTTVSLLGSAALVVGASFASKALSGKQGGQGISQANAPEVRYSTRQSAPPKRKVYGEAHIGGALFFEKVAPPYLVQGFLIHEGEIESVDDIYIGTNKLLFPGGIPENTILRPGVVAGQPDYESHLRVCVRLGKADQAHDALLRDRFGSDVIPDSFRQRGIATVVLEFKHPGNDFEAFQELWGQGRHPSSFFRIRGKKVFDPRKPHHVVDDPSTWEYSNNAALCQTDYMRADYGGRISDERVDWEKVKEAATYDDSPMGTLAGPFIPKHTCDGLFSLNQPPADVMGDLLSANRGTFVQEGGMVWPESSRPKQRVLTIHDGLLVGGLQFQPFKNRRELVNIVEPRFVAKEANYETIPGPEWRDEALIAAHGEDHRVGLSLPFTLDHRRAQRLAKLLGLEAQLEKSIAVQIDLQGLADATGPLTGGVVTVDSRLFPQANGDYEVKTLGFVEGFAAIELQCVEYDGSIESRYDPATDEKPFDPVPND